MRQCGTFLVMVTILVTGFQLYGAEPLWTGLQETTVLDSTAQMDPDSTDQPEGSEDSKTGLGAFPVIFYSDQTRMALGGGAQVVFKGQSENQTSSIGLLAFYTQNKQYVLNVGPEIYLRGGNLKVTGQFMYSYFPDIFFGVGNDTDEEYEDFTARNIAFLPSIQVKAISNLFIGMELAYYTTSLSDLEADGQLIGDTITGSAGGVISGLGVNASWDTRNNNIYATQGSYHQFKAVFFRPALGSEYTFNSYLLDLRHYHTISTDQIIALRGVIGLSTGEIPFQVMPQLGAYLRGYYPSRFRDNNLVAFQAEYRRPLYKWIGMVLFAGVGEVVAETGDFSLSELKPGAGFGLRFPLVKEQKVNLRIDIGIGKGDSSFDINIMEAF
ncbi:MAG: BamA/TamA family outer membrane protein [Candidatus Neomarinimicrobiota bacterium]